MTTDTLGDRMKEYEATEAYLLPPRSYCVLRVDGRAFHTWTRGLDRPFDEALAAAMDATAIALCQEIQGAVLGFVESDEISVIYTDFGRETTQGWFGRKVQKQVSIAASAATASFAWALPTFPSLLGRRIPTFDARVFTVPDAVEVANYLIWRQRDAIRNSVSMCAQAEFSHRELHGVNTGTMLTMLEGQGKPWADHSARFRHGGLVTKQSGIREVEYLDKRDQQTKTVMAERTWWEAAGSDLFTVDSLLPMLPVREDVTSKSA
jgi:tRNA(His) guanylyltransferase